MPIEYIYALVDPRSDAPFYIGRSIQPERRVYLHLSNFASVPVKACVDEIRAAGLEPTWAILEETKDGRTAECQWVQRCLAKGIVLANSFKTNNYRLDPEEKMVEAIPINIIPEKQDVTDNAGAYDSSNPATETSVSGLSDEFVEAIRAYATSRNEKLRIVYDEAIMALVERINGGEEIFFPVVVARQKWKARHIRISLESKEAMTATCDRLRVHKSVFFHRAMRDYLSSNGIDAPD